MAVDVAAVVAILLDAIDPDLELQDIQADHEVGHLVLDNKETGHHLLALHKEIYDHTAVAVVVVVENTVADYIDCSHCIDHSHCSFDFPKTCLLKLFPI